MCSFTVTFIRIPKPTARFHSHQLHVYILMFPSVTIINVYFDFELFGPIKTLYSLGPQKVEVRPCTVQQNTNACCVQSNKAATVHIDNSA